MQPQRCADTSVDESLERLATMPSYFAEIAGRLTPGQRRWKPSDDDWSLVEHICHMRDLEAEGYLMRIGRMLDEDVPSLPDFDGTRIALERNYIDDSFDAALEAFGRTRGANLRRVSGLPPERLVRTGELEGAGTVSIVQLLQMMCEHDDEHRRQISDLLEAMARSEH